MTRTIRFLVALLLVFGVLGFADRALATQCGITETAAANDWVDVFADDGQAIKVTATANCYVTSLEMKIGNIGSPPAHPFYLYSDSGGSPGTSLETGGNSSGGGTFPTAAYASSAFASTTCISSGTDYWVVIKKNGDDASNRALILAENTGPSGQLYTDAAGGGEVWTNGGPDWGAGGAKINGSTIASCPAGGGAVVSFLRRLVHSFGWW